MLYWFLTGSSKEFLRFLNSWLFLSALNRFLKRVSILDVTDIDTFVKSFNTEGNYIVFKSDCFFNSTVENKSIDS